MKNPFASASFVEIETTQTEEKLDMPIGRHTCICTYWKLYELPQIKVNAKGEEYEDAPHHEFRFKDVATGDESTLKVRHTPAAEKWFLGKVNRRTKGDLAIKCRPQDYLKLDPQSWGVLAQYLSCTPIELLYDESFFNLEDGTTVRKRPHLQIELPEDNSFKPSKSWFKT